VRGGQLTYLSQLYPKKNVRATIESAIRFSQAYDQNNSQASASTANQTSVFSREKIRSKVSPNPEQTSRLRSTSLQKKYTQLDQDTRHAINESFLLNIRQVFATQSKQSGVQDVMKEFYNVSTAGVDKQSHVNKIFGVQKSRPKPPAPLRTNGSAGKSVERK
jgi:hypothetical protein